MRPLYYSDPWDLQAVFRAQVVGVSAALVLQSVDPFRLSSGSLGDLGFGV